MNKQISDDLAVYAKEATLQQARAVNGLRAVFGETYPDPVRVVSVGVPVDELLTHPTDARWLNNSVEFCGGTYVAPGQGDVGQGRRHGRGRGRGRGGGGGGAREGRAGGEGR